MNGITQEELAALEEKIRELKAEIDSYNLDTLWEQANGLRAEIDDYNLDTLWEKANALNAEIDTIHKDYGAATSLHVDQEKYLHINASGEHPGVKVNQQVLQLFDVNNGQLRVTPDGNVGIGTSDPGAYKLYVKGGDLRVAKGAKDFSGRILVGSHGEIEYNVAPNDGFTILAGHEASQIKFTTREDKKTSHHMVIHRSGNVGIGTTGPGSKFQIIHDSEVAMSIGGTGNFDVGLQFLNYRRQHAGIRFSKNQLIVEDASSNHTPSSWNIGSRVLHFIVRNGNLDVNGDILQRGKDIRADYVFESDYHLESIEEHAAFMQQERHLKAIPKAEEDEHGQDIVEYGAHMRGMLEELEKAHIYIGQLNELVKKQQQEIEELKARLNENQ